MEDSIDVDIKGDSSQFMIVDESTVVKEMQEELTDEPQIDEESKKLVEKLIGGSENDPDEDGIDDYLDKLEEEEDNNTWSNFIN